MVDIECTNCGSTFNKKPSLIEKSENHFCDKECHGEYLSKNNTGENHWQYDRIEVECNNCGKMKDVTPSHFKQVNNFYCDAHCQAEHEDRSGENNGNWKPKVETKCKYCGDEINIYQWRYQRDGNNFCDRECRNDWMSENHVSENHPQYKGGPLYYGNEWFEKRRRVKDRDDNECQLCDDGDEQTPDVHHINPVREFDDPNNAHTMDNMIQLCRSCHRKVEGLDEETQRNVLEFYR